MLNSKQQMLSLKQQQQLNSYLTDKQTKQNKKE